MRDRLPPLFSLQVFETAARLNSFSKAAIELKLTPGAISRQVKNLEDWCSQTLFERNGPHIKVSKNGVELLARLKGPLSALHQAVFPPEMNATQPLQISTLASFAKSWLLPRLKRFHENNSQVNLTVHTDHALVRPAPRIPVALLRYGALPQENNGDLICEILFDEYLVAVCSPDRSSLSGSFPTDWTSSSLLKHQTLDASDWLRAVGLKDTIQRQGIFFNDADVLLDAAENSLGIGISRLTLAWPRLQSGSLVLASKIAVATRRKYLLLYRRDCAESPIVSAFASWMLEEAADWHLELSEILSDFELIEHDATLHPLT